MYVDLCKYKRGNKSYKRVLLRGGYREGGKVKHRTLANPVSYTHLTLPTIYSV